MGCISIGSISAGAAGISMSADSMLTVWCDFDWFVLSFCTYSVTAQLMVTRLPRKALGTLHTTLPNEYDWLGSHGSTHVVVDW